MTGAHLGVHKTYQKIRERYYWRNMYKDCEHWCKTCVDCAIRKTPRTARKAPLIPIPVEGPFDKLAVDILGPFPPSNSGNRYLVVFSDYLSRWPESFPVKSTDAVTIARLFLDEIVSRHGAPRTLLSDRGKNFLSNLVKEVCKLFRIRKCNTTAYHPQCDGLMERYNHSLCQSISMFVSKNQRDWDLHIPAILFGFRVSISETTGDSPLYLIYGREPRLPLDISLIAPTDPSSSIAEHRRRIVSNIELSQDIARQNIQRAQQKMKDYYDRNAKEPTFEVGERVWVYTPKTKKGPSKKLLHRWYGPYRIVEQLSPVHYRLRTCDNKHVTSSVHANRMKKYFDPADRPIEPLEDYLDEPYLEDIDIDDARFQFSPDLETPPNVTPNPTLNLNPSQTKPKTKKPKAMQKTTHKDQEGIEKTVQTTNKPVEINNQTIFNAERIVQSRIRKGKTQYLVKWAGFPDSENIWENEENILDQRLIDSFNKPTS